MKKTVPLIPPPTAMQPGGYIAKAYADRNAPGTARAEVEATESNGTWTVTLRWHAPRSVIDASADPRLFIDGCALFVPTVKDASWITMGAPDMPIEGALWRADRPQPLHVAARGLGTVTRSDAPAGWRAEARYANGTWQVAFALPMFRALAERRQFAFAVWQGALGERAGLKSVSPGWIDV